MKQNTSIKTETFKTILIFAASLSLTQCAQVPTLLDADGVSEEQEFIDPGVGQSNRQVRGRALDSDGDGELDGIDRDEDGVVDEPLDGKVLLCHNDNNPHTISISPNAVDAHLRNHNDCLGACPCE